MRKVGQKSQAYRSKWLVLCGIDPDWEDLEKRPCYAACEVYDIGYAEQEYKGAMPWAQLCQVLEIHRFREVLHKLCNKYKSSEEGKWFFISCEVGLRTDRAYTMQSIYIAKRYFCLAMSAETKSYIANYRWGGQFRTLTNCNI